MTDEYLLFDLVVLSGPAYAASLPATSFRGRWRAALVAALIVAVPFLVWDVAVTGRHWFFDARHTAWHVLGLPIGEWLFFLVVPLACSYTWEMVTGGVDPTPVRSIRAIAVVAGALVVAAAVVLSGGREYTAFACAALAAAVALDLLGGGVVLRHRRAAVFVVLVLAFTGIFNGYLTARPLVLYDARYQLAFRIGTIPIEDFVYGLALVVANVTLYERWRDRLGAPRTPLGDTVFRRMLRARLGDYRQRIDVPNDDRPRTLVTPRRVAVIGAGLAGLRAATILAARGFAVELFDAATHLGGKIGAWDHTLPDGSVVEVEHGFHAFFRHYYNLHVFLDEIGASASLRPIADYRILTRDGTAYGFRDLDTTPILNVVSLLRTPMLRPRDVLLRPRLSRLTTMMAYDPERTFARWDDVSFADFAARVDLPPPLRVVFNSFARAFFSTPERMSAAEVIKSFHFYYLGHDLGLLYDHPCDTYGRTILGPLRARLDALGVEPRLGTAVERIDVDGARLCPNGVAFDYVVLAADVVGARAIAEASPALRAAAPTTTAALASLQAAQPNAVLRLWLDRPSGDDLPGFVVVDKERLLDSITFVHHVEATSGAWAARSGGSVVELHCYAVPDGVDETTIAPTMEAELRAHVASLANATILARRLQVNRNFTAFHVGLHARRPGVETDHPGLFLAGDWVALSSPAMLMEAAVTAGLEAANAILRREGLSTEAVYSVPLRGLLARRRRGAN